MRKAGSNPDNYNAYKREYEELINTFNPVKFNPGKWASAAKDAGMKYITLTTRHHEGFSLFDAKQGYFFSPRFNMRYQLSDKVTLRAGTGQSVKSVSLTQIYKTPKHISYYDTLLQVDTEKVIYQVNENLKSYVSQKTEASLDWRINKLLGASLTGYYTKTKNRPNGITYPEGYDINPDTINIDYTYTI